MLENCIITNGNTEKEKNNNHTVGDSLTPPHSHTFPIIYIILNYIGIITYFLQIHHHVLGYNRCSKWC